MENSEDDDKRMNRAKSHNCCLQQFPLKFKSEPFKSESAKKKSFNVNEAVRSLDLALGRLKKSKLVNGEYITMSTPINPMRRESKNMYMDVRPSSQVNPGIGNASLMSMNFSQYELVRNLSNSNCNSDGAFSCSTCNVRPRPADANIRDEHLERFFRSAEMWTQRYNDGPSHLAMDIDKP